VPATGEKVHPDVKQQFAQEIACFCWLLMVIGVPLVKLVETTSLT
jgi:hypothetical protein